MSDREREESSGVSRREFLKISGIAAASVPLVAGPTVLKVAGQEVAIHGPDKSPVTLMGERKKVLRGIGTQGQSTQDLEILI